MTRINTPVVSVRILNFLKTGRDITTKQARSRFGITNVSARISELRQAGYAIYLNQKTSSNGRSFNVYRLGKPSRQMVAIANLVMSEPSFAPIVAEALGRVRSLDATLTVKG